MNNVYVSLCIDDLDARDDPTRSDRVAAYDFTKKEIAQIMAMIKAHKREHTNSVGFLGHDRPLENENEEDPVS